MVKDVLRLLRRVGLDLRDVKSTDLLIELDCVAQRLASLPVLKVSSHFCVISANF